MIKHSGALAVRSLAIAYPWRTIKKKAFKGFRIESSVKSIKNLPLDEIKSNPEIRRMGWNFRQLLNLMGSLQIILRNFERITEDKIKLEIVFSKQNPKNEAAIFGMDWTKKEMQVYLKPGPEKAHEQVPMVLSQELAKLLFELDIFELADIDPWVIGKGLAGIRQFYADERGIELDENILGESFVGLIEIYGHEIAKRKISYLLLSPHCPPEKEIKNLIDGTLSEISEIVTKPQINPDKVSVLNFIASLAMLSALAKKFKCSVASIKCQSALSGELGRHLAMIELLELPHSKVKHFLRHQFETERQLTKAIPGFNLTFNIFQMLFESYYDDAQMPQI